MNLHFDIRDIFRCVRLGWSGKKIWVGLLGLIVAWAGYSVLLLIAHVRAGGAGLWQRYGLFPGATLGEFDLFGTGLHVFGYGVCPCGGVCIDQYDVQDHFSATAGR